MTNVKDRDFVYPGQLLAEKAKAGSFCIQDGERIISAVCGLVRIDGNNVSVIPSAGSYTPKVDDVVSGVISNVGTGHWKVNIGAPYECTMLPGDRIKDSSEANLRTMFDVGDRISAKIVRVNEVYDTLLERPWKLDEGLIIYVNPKRVPRVVGKKRSMLELLKAKTRCQIVVGQNGYVWIKGDNVGVAVEAIRKIEAEAQTRGLTDRVGKMLDEKIKSTIKKGSEKR